MIMYINLEVRFIKCFNVVLLFLCLLKNLFIYFLYFLNLLYTRYIYYYFYVNKLY